MTILLFLLACPSTSPDSGDARSACLDEGGGFGDEDLAAIEDECVADGGTDCDPDAFIEADAATCLAAADGLDDGLDGLHADLVYNVRYGTVVWSVYNVEEESTGSQSGSGRDIHATTGEVLGPYDWGSME